MNIHFRLDVPVNTAVIGIGTDEAIKVNTDSTCAMHLHSRGGANNDPELIFSNYDNDFGNNDNMGIIYFAATPNPKPVGYNVSGGFDFGASVWAEGDGDWDVTTDVPGKLNFSTTPAGTSMLTQRMTIKSDGDIGIGTPYPQSITKHGVSLHIHGDGPRPEYGFEAEYGGGNGAGELILSGEDRDFDIGDRLGSIYFGGYDGSWDYGAAIIAELSGNAIDAGSNFPTNLYFQTCETGSTTLRTRMSLNHSGDLRLGRKTQGAAVGYIIVGSTTLDDFTKPPFPNKTYNNTGILRIEDKSAYEKTYIFDNTSGGDATGIIRGSATATITVDDGDAVTGMTECEKITITNTNGTTRVYRLCDDTLTTVATGDVLEASDNATATITFTGIPSNDEIITLRSTTGIHVSYVKKTYQDLTADPREFGGGTAAAAATSLKACIDERTDFIVSDNESGVLTVTQYTAGGNGNGPMVSGLTNVTVSDFTGGGSDTGALNPGTQDDGDIAVSINIASSEDTQREFLVQLKAAIEHANGHNGTINVSAVPAEDDGEQSITLTQDSYGTAGNTAITTDISQVTEGDFTGGEDLRAAIGGKVVIQLNGMTTPVEIAAEIETAIEHVNGHGGVAGGSSITVSRSTATLTLTQEAGATGNANELGDTIFTTVTGSSGAALATTGFFGGTDAMSATKYAANSTSIHIHGDAGGNSSGELILTSEDTDFDAGNNYGAIFFGGTEDGDVFDFGAAIIGECDAADSAPGSDMPGRIKFMTTPDGSTTLTERMKIDSAGTVRIGTGKHIISVDQDIRYAYPGNTMVIAELPGVKIPANAIITSVAAVVKTASNLSTHLVHIQLSATSGTSADTAVSSGTEILGNGVAGTDSTDSASASDIDLVNDLKEVWICRDTVRNGSSDQYVYICNAGTGNGNTNSTAGTLTVIIEYYGMD